MKIIETGPGDIGFVLWGHCQNLLDDPRKSYKFSLMSLSDKQTEHLDSPFRGIDVRRLDHMIVMASLFKWSNLTSEYGQQTPQSQFTDQHDDT